VPPPVLPDREDADRLSNTSTASTFLRRWLPATLDRWSRRGIIATFATAFTLPYFRLLNEVRVEGDDLLSALPRRNVIFLSNHQTYFLEAIAFFDLVYVRHRFPLEDPVLRFSAAEETMKMNPLTLLMRRAGGVTLRRRYRDAGQSVDRPPDLEGIARILEAIRSGWLLHFPTGTTKHLAPIRPGVARILHDTKPIAVPVRIDGFRRLLLLRQVPGRFFRRCKVRIRKPLDLRDFYEAPFTQASGEEVVRRIQDALKPGESGD
jgi:1-acyl-sn-glycerol-3-phosphate acyltransferase